MRFVGLYEGRTVAEAKLVAVSGSPRLVSLFFEQLAGEAPAEGEASEEPRGRVLELARGEPDE